MARTPESKIINGHKWEVTPWPGMYGLKMQAKLAPLVSGAVAPVINAIGGAKKGSDPVDALMAMDVDSVVAKLLSHIDETQTPALIEAMLYGSFVDGKDITSANTFNEHFQANYGELYRGLAFVVAVNMGDLFSMAALTGHPESAAE
jgi:hypothetical protein